MESKGELRFSQFDEAWLWLREEGTKEALDDWLGAVVRLAHQLDRPIPDGLVTGFASWVSSRSWMSWQDAQNLLLPQA